LLCAALLVLSFLFVRIEGGNLYQMTICHNNAETAVRKCGILSHFFIDSGKTLFHVEEEIILVPEEPEVPEEPSPEEPEKIVYKPHVFDIDFDRLIEEDSDAQLKQLDEYFKIARPTYENEYTGYFKGKNLIYIMAESFNEIAVTKELTPTLYRLIHQGFEFKNYYSPTIYSTIGGECQELTGLFFAPRMLGIWKRGTNAFPMGLATVFKEAGYKTYAYHNSDFTFQDRDKYLAALGFDNFTGCGNGLEQKMACKWVASDKDLIDATVDDYTGEEPFMVYYATVSGHGEYWPDHEQAKKYMDLVNEYYGDEVSVTARSYVATQIELDRAMQELLLKLEQKGVLEDTVIVLAADHHPYFLDLKYINELSDYERDSSIESQSSSLIIYNPSVPHTEIEKVCGTPDVLPTVYNLFDIPYDSRLMTGKDIFSTEPGFVAFSDWSFVSDKGSFNSVKGVFTPKEGLEVSEEEEDALWAQVASRFNTSSLILEKNYYAHVIK
ncbi:MAG: LTA synthase family protein, partial [Erysipelotrichaceae bacterium]|nr:LTA synthase family protein [Erysipelotrichaceae bacterium]